MSSEIPVPVPDATADATPAAAPKPRKPQAPLPAKVQKRLDVLEARNTKLSEDNKRLKQTMAELKSSNSRIRRIPKPSATAEPVRA